MLQRTKQVFTLELTSKEPNETVYVDIYAMAGIRVFNGELPANGKHTLSLEDYLPGIYLVRVIAGQQIGIERLIRR